MFPRLKRLAQSDSSLTSSKSLYLKSVPPGFLTQVSVGVPLLQKKQPSRASCTLAT